MRLFTTKKIYNIAAETNEELREWYSVLRSVLEASFTKSEIETKNYAAKVSFVYYKRKSLEPLYKQQLKAQIEEYYSIIKVSPF